MNTNDLDPDEIAALDRTAMLLYTSYPGGISAVCDLANLLKWDEFAYCDLCDNTLPMLHEHCMACGSEITSTEEEPANA